ncbi:MAG: alpha/beta hydrolase, partial [Pseudomonadota bacterium]
MSASPRIIGAVLRKDLLIVWPMALMSAALIVFGIAVERLQIDIGLLTPLLLPLTWLASAVLVVAVIQQDTAISVRHDWLTRPTGRFNVIAAKCLFIGLTLLLPAFLARLVGYLAAGWAPLQALGGALQLDMPAVLLALPVVIAVAATTATLLQAVATLVAILLFVLVLPSFLPEMGVPVLDETVLSGGLGWIVFVPLVWLSLGLVAAVLLLVYRSRRPLAARLVVAGVSILIVSLLVLIKPDQALALQRSVSTANPPEDFDVSLAGGCFASETVSGSATTEQALRKSSFQGRGTWSNDQLEEAGPNPVAFSTLLASRGIPEGWRLKVTHVSGRWRDAAGRELAQISASGPGSRPVVTLAGVTGAAHFWLLPRAAADRLVSAAMPRLELRYALALLEPHTLSLPVDGRRHAYPGLGYCSVTRDPSQGEVVLDCFTHGRQPAFVHAQFEGALRGVDERTPDFRPGWLSPLSGSRHRLAVPVPRGVNASHLNVTAYSARTHLQRQINVPGVLGGPVAACAIPAATPPAADAPLQSIWRDTSPHESLRITVADGVQLEVLDWGGTGQPLVLLAGLSNSAHIYDEFAVKLAKHFHVYGISRRGHGNSTTAEAGYDVPNLANDVLRVVDALKLSAPLIAGHSIASEELSELGARHSERIAGLIYIDGPDDRATKVSGELRALGRTLPPPPEPTAQDTRSYAAVTAYSTRLGGVGYPEGEFVADYEIAADGSLGMRRSDPLVFEEIENRVQHPDYGKIRVPALGFYARPRNAMRPWFDANDPKLLGTVARIHDLQNAERDSEKAAFLGGLKGSKAIDIVGGKHHLFISNEAEVLDA